MSTTPEEPGILPGDIRQIDDANEDLSEVPVDHSLEDIGTALDSDGDGIPDDLDVEDDPDLPDVSGDDEAPVIDDTPDEIDDEPAVGEAD